MRPATLILPFVLGLTPFAPTPLPAQEPAPAASDSELLVAACNRFAADLYGELQQQGPPTCSPASIAIALHLLLPGARGETADEIARLLALPAALRGERLAAATEQLLASVQPEGSEHRLRITNDVWLQRDHPVLAGYVDAVQRLCGAAPHTVDFGADPTAARQLINDHVAKATNGRIPDLLPADAIVPLTRVVLTNALWFKDAWRTPFAAAATAPQPFTLAGGDRVDVPMMHVTDSFRHAAGDDWQCVVLPFAHSSLQFECCLPAAGGRLDAAEAVLLAGSHLPLLQAETVQVSLPRFKVQAAHDLVPTLQRLGMRSAFAADRADFRGIDGTRDLWVSHAVHRTWLAVDEHGAEAAAATAIVLKARGLPRVQATFLADRPFAFALRDTETGLLWFVGRVDDPRPAA